MYTYFKGSEFYGFVVGKSSPYTSPCALTSTSLMGSRGSFLIVWFCHQEVDTMSPPRICTLPVPQLLKGVRSLIGVHQYSVFKLSYMAKH